MEVQKDAGYGSEGRQRCNDHCDDGGHPAQARDLVLRARTPELVRNAGRAGADSPDVGTRAAERFSLRLLRRHGRGPV